MDLRLWKFGGAPFHEVVKHSFRRASPWTPNAWKIPAPKGRNLH